MTEDNSEVTFWHDDTTSDELLERSCVNGLSFNKVFGPRRNLKLFGTDPVVAAASRRLTS